MGSIAARVTCQIKLVTRYRELFLPGVCKLSRINTARAHSSILMQLARSFGGESNVKPVHRYHEERGREGGGEGVNPTIETRIRHSIWNKARAFVSRFSRHRSYKRRTVLRLDVNNQLPFHRTSSGWVAGYSTVKLSYRTMVDNF